MESHVGCYEIGSLDFFGPSLPVMLIKKMKKN